jgi:hypothetical protein
MVFKVHCGVGMTDKNLDRCAVVCARLEEIHPDFHPLIKTVCSACNGNGGQCVVDAMQDVVWDFDPSRPKDKN